MRIYRLKCIVNKNQWISAVSLFVAFGWLTFRWSALHSCSGLLWAIQGLELWSTVLFSAPQRSALWPCRDPTSFHQTSKTSTQSAVSALPGADDTTFRKWSTASDCSRSSNNICPTDNYHKNVRSLIYSPTATEDDDNDQKRYCKLWTGPSQDTNTGNEHFHVPRLRVLYYIIVYRYMYGYWRFSRNLIGNQNLEISLAPNEATAKGSDYPQELG